MLKGNIAIFITGGIARGDLNPKSDIDILTISRSGHSFEEKKIEGRLVEVKTNTLDGFKQKMIDEPMNVYQWLDAKAMHDPENLLPELQKHAEYVLDNYTPPAIPRKWLESTLIKIDSARLTKNDQLLGFHVSNILWKIVESIYIINSLPTPPSTTAFKRIKALKNLPENFDIIWSDVLTGDLKLRAAATTKLIKYLIE
jgi:predicted nucleotidyltransferase